MCLEESTVTAFGFLVIHLTFGVIASRAFNSPYHRFLISLALLEQSQMPTNSQRLPSHPSLPSDPPLERCERPLYR